MPKKIALISAAMGWGAQKQGTAFGPSFLRSAGLGEELQDLLRIPVVWFDCPVSSMPVADDACLSVELRWSLITRFNQHLAHLVMDVMKEGFFPVVLGGDHSIACGTWGGVTTFLKAQRQFGLLWIDAHMDAHIPETSFSKAPHGMPVAGLLGYGRQDFIHAGSPGAKIDPRHLVQWGIRSYESAEEDFLNSLNISIIKREMISEKNNVELNRDILHVLTSTTKGFGMTIDLDAFDPSEAPGVGSPEENGVEIESTLDLLSMLASSSSFQALEIAEYNPLYDQKNKTSKLITRLIQTCIKKDV